MGAAHVLSMRATGCYIGFMWSRHHELGERSSFGPKLSSTSNGDSHFRERIPGSASGVPWDWTYWRERLSLL